MKKVKFIYNPYSGEGKIVDKLDNIIRLYQKNGYQIILYRLDFECDINDSFKENHSDFHHVLISGGDGTINQVVNSMKQNNIDLPIAIIPSGTANDFAKMLQITDNIEKNLKNIFEGMHKTLDIGKINDKYFVNVASAGMFTDVSQRINSDFKHSIGKVSYYIKGIEDAINLKQFDVSVKSNEFNYDGAMYLMLVFNGKTAGNLHLAYKSKADDGLLDVIIFKAMPIPQTLHMLIKVITQSHLEKESDLIYFRTNKVQIDCKNNLRTDIDGEKGPNFPLTIECIKNGLTILGISS